MPSTTPNKPITRQEVKRLLRQKQGSGGSTGANTGGINDNAVTFEKLADIPSDTLVGRDSSGEGDPESITVGGGLEFTGSKGIQTTAFTGDVTKPAGSVVLTITDNAVTNAKLADISQDRIKGRITIGLGDPEDLTITQVLGLGNTGMLAEGSNLYYTQARFDSAFLAATFANGTAGTPSIRFTNDLDTGVFRAGVNAVGIAAAATEVMRIDFNTGVRGSFGYARNYDNLIGGQHAPDFRYDGPTDKLFFRSAIITEEADTSEIAIRRVNGTLIAPTPVLAGELTGIIYWQPWLADPLGWGTGISPNESRSAQIQGRLTDPQAASPNFKSGGAFAIGVTKHGEQVIRERVIVQNDGNVAIVSDGVLTGLDSTKTDYPSVLNVYAPNTLVKPALSLRQQANPDFGYDFDIESAAVGRLDCYTVVSGVRTLSFSVDRTTASLDLKNIPKAPTATPGTNTTQLATTAFVQQRLGAGLDGDKGDITVSASGATWTIDPDVVTYTKIQNVSATDKVLGRSTAGAGDIEEITMTAAARALNDDADAPSMRTTLGLGTADTVTFARVNAPSAPASSASFSNSNIKVGVVGATGTDVGDIFIEKDGDGVNNTFVGYVGNVAAGLSFFEAPFFVLQRSRGTLAIPTTVSVGDWEGGIGFRGKNTAAGITPTGFSQNVIIRAEADSTPGATDFAGRFIIATRDTAGGVLETARFSGNGAVAFPRIGTTASAANAFLDSGSSPANNLLRSTSSAKYKRAVETLDSSYADNILKLRPVWYRSSVKQDRQDWSWYGLLAEEVATVDPRLVHYGYHDEDFETVNVGNPMGAELTRLKSTAVKKPDGVAYERLTVLLLDIVKRQQIRIAALESRLGILT